MRRFAWACVPFAAGLAVLGGSGAATAACGDAPAPGVVWQRCLFDGANLGGHDLHDATLRESSFGRTNLAGATLDGVDARRAKFVSADLSGAHFENARLFEADFTKAKLAGAILRKADLRGAILFRADLRAADLTDAQIGRAVFEHADLSGARWIDGKTVCAEGSIGQCG